MSAAGRTAAENRIGIMSILSVDIGGTFIKYAVMERSGTIGSRGKAPTPGTRDGLLHALADIFSAFDNIEGITVSLPGIIDAENGRILMGGGALTYNDGFDLGPELEKLCGVPVHLENDAKCAAMAEAGDGALKDVSDGFVIILGTMIGGAFIKDHKLHRGTHFSAGEVSYIISATSGMSFDENIWGKRGSVRMLCRLYAEKNRLDPDSVDGTVVFDAVENGDASAKEALRQYARELAVQIFNIQTVLDPQRFAIGGGISERPALLEAIRSELDAIYAACPYTVPHAEVTVCRFRNDANLIGALQCWLSR